MKTAQRNQARTPEEIARNLAVLQGTAKSWAGGAALLAAWVYLHESWLFTPLVYIGIALTYTSIFYALIRRGLTERFTDPTLTFPQLNIALANQCFCLWLAPEAGIFFLLAMFQTCAFGLFSLTVKQFRMLLYFAALGTFTALMISRSHLSLTTTGLQGVLLLFLTFLMSLEHFIRVAGYVSSLRDRVSAKNKELKESEARFRALTQLSSDWYWEQDAELRFTRLESGKDHKLTIQNLLLGKRLWESKFVPESNDDWQALRSAMGNHADFRDMVIKYRLSDQNEYFVSLSGEPIFDKGVFSGYRGVAREVTDEKLAEERIQYIATHDGLTGLPNRIMLNQLLTMMMHSSQRNSWKFGVLFIDLDRFKPINDMFGHDVGDSLLQGIASRFTQALRASDIVIRLGGDEFIALIAEVESREQVANVASKLLAAAIQPMVISGHTCQVSASIGIALFPDDALDEQTLLKNADRAMYLAKEAGKNNFQFYTKAASIRPIDPPPVDFMSLAE